MSNPEEIREAIVDLRNDLDEFDMFLDEGDYENIFAFFEAMKSARDSINQ